MGWAALVVLAGVGAVGVAEALAHLLPEMIEEAGVGVRCLDRLLPRSRLWWWAAFVLWLLVLYGVGVWRGQERLSLLLLCLGAVAVACDVLECWVPSEALVLWVGGAAVVGSGRLLPVAVAFFTGWGCMVLTMAWFRQQGRRLVVGSQDALLIGGACAWGAVGVGGWYDASCLAWAVMIVVAAGRLAFGGGALPAALFAVQGAVLVLAWRNWLLSGWLP